MSDDTMDVIRFSGNDEECTHLIPDNYTKVVSSRGLHNKGSSNLTLKNFVDFNWEHEYYRGQLIALHISEQYIAYGFSKPDTTEGLVRIIQRVTDERALIKGFSSIIEDIKFAHLYENIMLACIDQVGSVFVYIIKEDMNKKLNIFTVFQINGDPLCCFKNEHLLSWCQFIPEQTLYLNELESEKTYKGKMLAVVRGPDVEIWHIGMASNFTAGPIYGNLELNKSFESDMLNNIKSALIKINMKDSDIISIAFSPDGSTISIGIASGTVYFYQILFECEQPPKCVFTWNPQDVFLSLKSLFFLDNRKNINGDVELWKYAVTLSTNNEIVLWSCETWGRIQKLAFVRPFLTESQTMKLSIDETGRYLFLSDIDNNLLYVMEVSVDITSPNKGMKIVCITEILLQTPMLNMIVVNAKIDHNDVHFTEQSDSGDNSNNLNKYTTIINLFAIQPKSLQEGQLIISSPELSITEQFIDKKQIQPKNKFLKSPTLDIAMQALNLPSNIIKGPKMHSKNTKPLVELSSMEVHNLVKEKLKLKGIHIDQKNVLSPTNTIQLQNTKQNKYNNTKQIKLIKQTSPPTNVYTQKPYDLHKDKEISPNELMFHEPYASNSKSQNYSSFQYREESKDNLKSKDNLESTSNYSMEIGKDETNCCSGGSIFNGSSISIIKEPMDKSQTTDYRAKNQIDEIYTYVKDINSQLKWLTERQEKLDKDAISLSLSKSDICKSIETTLTSVVKITNDQTLRKIQIIVDQHQKKIAEIVKNSSNSNKVDTELFTRSLVASLNPTLDAILKELFMSTVIPKFEHACCSMFKQIDTSFTERSLEYQNELKLLLNEEGNINYKLEYAFEKFKTDMSNIIKQTETQILSSQTDMQKQFTFLLQEKSLSHVESFVKDSEIIANQFLMLDNLLDVGDFTTAFEKALSASNLELVIYVCEKVQPEEFFLTPNVMKTPIILSLIQQLSHDLITNTELKHKYLDAAVGILNYTNDLHKENINLVLIKMNANIEKFIQRYSSHPYARKFKMLLLAVRTIISYN